ncbi:MAG TPA: NfeD family protein, partial [Acidimicrobiia bacterium]|nr:NfeD family protein [Acidimicrobiia bacterium]
ATVVILQVDSQGFLDTAPLEIINLVRTSKVPVAAWVGPGKAKAEGAVADLVMAASFAAASPGARIGPGGPYRLDHQLSDGGTVLEAIPGVPSDRFEARLKRQDLHPGRLSGAKAAEGGLIDAVAPTLGDLIVALNDKDVPAAGATVHLVTTKQIDTKGGPRQTADQPVSFHKLGTFASIEHALASPSMVFLLLIVGLGLMVFEFFTVGIGLAGLVGAGAVAGALFGCSHLPVTGWALALLFLSTFGFAIDVQAGHQGFWTGVGVVGLLVGSLKLFGGSSSLDVPLWLVAVIFIGQLIFMLGGMTVAVRNRFSVPTVGRDSMIGEIGEARTDLKPDGVVTVRGAPWRARTNRATPVSAGLPIRVVAVDRLVLEVEPGDVLAEG